MTSMRSTSRRFLALALTAAGCAGLTACGSAAKPSAGASGSAGAHNAGVRFADCMRTHGVPNFPDPPAGGGGIQINSSSGIDPFSPSFRAAQQDCHTLLPFGGPGRQPTSAARKEQLVKLSRCMRAHGISNFPDPTNSPPSSPPAGGGGVAFGGPGGFISIPSSIMQSPGFQQYAKVCGFPGGGPPPPGHAGAKSLTLK